jgi:dipeptide/tripeptide permease
MSLLHQLSTVVAPWADFYNASKVAQSAVTFGHFGGMMTAGGFALAADRATLRAAAAPATEQPRFLEELAGTHPIVVAALAVTALSGLLMFAADLENLGVNPAFWIKMGLVALLLGNGWLMLRAEQQLIGSDPADRRGWRRLRRVAVASLVLWFAVVLAGSILPNAS